MIGRLYRLSGAATRNRASEVLERFGLVEAADRRVATYSGGMRRRLDLAAGLIGRPPVILLDEPTTGLDPRSRQELWNIVDELRRDGHDGAAHDAIPRGGRSCSPSGSRWSTTAAIAAQGTAARAEGGDRRAAMLSIHLADRAADVPCGHGGAREPRRPASSPTSTPRDGEIRIAVADPAPSRRTRSVSLDARRLPDRIAVELQQPTPRRRIPDPHRASGRSRGRPNHEQYEQEAA